MDRAIKVSEEDYRLIRLISVKESWALKITLSKAIQFFAKVKRVIKR